MTIIHPCLAAYQVASQQMSWCQQPQFIVKVDMERQTNQVTVGVEIGRYENESNSNLINNEMRLQNVQNFCQVYENQMSVEEMNVNQ